jgi:transposase
LFAGIDTHKDTLAVAVIDDVGRRLAGGQLPNTEPGLLELVELLDAHKVTKVGIEGSGNFGRAIAVHLAISWTPDREVSVVEVPPTMTARERRAQVGRGKTDPVDALAIARITAREPGLPPVRLTVGPAADLRALLDYRDDLMAERTALVNRVHAELTGLAPGYQQRLRSLTSRTRVQAALELLAGDTGIRAGLCRRRLERVLEIDADAAAVKRQIAALVEASGSTLTQMHGVGPVVAARFLAEVVDITRYANRDKFASANGSAPIPASSGRTVRHRFNPGGNRQMNRALYTIALTQIREQTEGRAYYERKRAQGKSKREAMRSLKRRLSDLVYQTMRADARVQVMREPIEAMGAAIGNEARLTA